ncbi:MAG: OmpA family protein [Paracoccaceae bacterium]
MTNTTRNRVNPAALALVLCLGIAPAGAARALDLSLPGNARETADRASSPDSYGIATGPYAGGALPLTDAEGAVNRSAWRIEAQGITTLQLLAPLRAQLTEAGFTPIFECEAAACGGFDFRYGLDVFPEPAMHVDLFDYRYLSARRAGEDGTADYVALLISRSANAGFVQIATVTPPGAAAPRTAASGTPARRPQTAPATGTAGTARPGDTAPLAERLLSEGHAVLADLTFETGSSSLGAGDFASLAALADFLKDDPARRVALVGHTDAVGALDTNIALSKRRAASVLERLAGDYGIPRGQLTAEGMGYLSPVTTNLTAEGREQNRRVEAVLLNTD